MQIPLVVRTGWLKLACLSILVACLPGLRAKSLDDFNGPAKTGWTDFTFVPGFGLPVQNGGLFRFEQPPAGQAIFSASQKSSETFELKEGRTVEFRVDVIEGGGKDSFAILAFIPTGNSPGTLSGYGLAKSTTDVLITKGINKYFAAVSGEEANLKQNNIRLVLNLTVRGGSVYITTKVHDLEELSSVCSGRRYRRPASHGYQPVAVTGFHYGDDGTEDRYRNSES